MAKAPKNELAIKTVIAALVTAANVGMDTKLTTNIRLKNKAFFYTQNGSLGNLAVNSEQIVFWLMIQTKPDTDFAAFENAVNTATNTAFNGLQIVSVREVVIDGNWQRYYEIKVN